MPLMNLEERQAAFTSLVVKNKSGKRKVILNGEDITSKIRDVSIDIPVPLSPIVATIEFFVDDLEFESEQA